MTRNLVQGMVKQYFEQRLIEQNAYKYLKQHMDQAIVLVVGSYSFGMSHSQSDLDVEMIVPDHVHSEMLKLSGGPKALWVHDEDYFVLVDIKVRPFKWLIQRLNGDPVALWVYDQAVCVQDPYRLFDEWLDKAKILFREKLDQYIFNSYKDLKIGVTLSEQRDLLGRYLIAAKTIEASLVLPVLLKELPYPYPKWQGWWLINHEKSGKEIVQMCEQFIAGEPSYRPLLNLINELLVQNGYGDITKNFWRKL